MTEAEEIMELMRLAALAAPGVVDGPIGSVWNPANDDADSKQLRDALGIFIMKSGRIPRGVYVTASHKSGVHNKQSSTWFGGCEHAATRMATLRVAARLGSAAEGAAQINETAFGHYWRANGNGRRCRERIIALEAWNAAIARAASESADYKELPELLRKPVAWIQHFRQGLRAGQKSVRRAIMKLKEPM